jgi:alkanesulfonate monooxygenase SsuD/methylene tetrahydromethanopterin reductase-like flavin-dependent oxidoreductase (luciferase family)
VRGDMLDEALQVVTGLWKGESFSHAGVHYQVKGTRFLPACQQQPRIPIWVGGIWPHKRPLARMAQWDGMFPLFFNAQSPAEALDQFKQSVAAVRATRRSPAPFDVIALGATPLDDPQAALQSVRPYADAGATWWLESIAPQRMGRPGEEQWSVEQLLARVRQGPPRL